MNCQGASASPANVLEPIAGPSGLSARGIGSGEDYSAILGIDIRDLPEGVDPSFLVKLSCLSCIRLILN